MVVIDARVDNGDDDRGTAGRDSPGVLGADVGAADTRDLPRVVEAPLIRKATGRSADRPGNR